MLLAWHKTKCQTSNTLFFNINKTLSARLLKFLTVLALYNTFVLYSSVKYGMVSQSLSPTNVWPKVNIFGTVDKMDPGLTLK